MASSITVFWRTKRRKKNGGGRARESTVWPETVQLEGSLKHNKKNKYSCLRVGGGKGIKRKNKQASSRNIVITLIRRIQGKTNGKNWNTFKGGAESDVGHFAEIRDSLGRTEIGRGYSRTVTNL